MAKIHISRAYDDAKDQDGYRIRSSGPSMAKRH